MRSFLFIDDKRSTKAASYSHEQRKKFTYVVAMIIDRHQFWVYTLRRFVIPILPDIFNDLVNVDGFVDAVPDAAALLKIVEQKLRRISRAGAKCKLIMMTMSETSARRLKFEDLDFL
uniref:Uncharacterized protein n=1 Tax=Romanomermis culicivorax TaxID=13658 RepID=A0A915KXX8_ROMCU